MLVLVRSFSYTPDASFSEEFLFPLELVIVRRIPYNPGASFSEEFLLHSSSWL